MTSARKMKAKGEEALPLWRIFCGFLWRWWWSDEQCLGLFHTDASTRCEYSLQCENTLSLHLTAVRRKILQPRNTVQRPRALRVFFSGELTKCRDGPRTAQHVLADSINSLNNDPVGRVDVAQRRRIGDEHRLKQTSADRLGREDALAGSIIDIVARLTVDQAATHCFRERYRLSSHLHGATKTQKHLITAAIRRQLKTQNRICIALGYRELKI